MNIQEFRQQYPQYDHVDDTTLARKLHEKSYSHVPYETFTQKFGVSAEPTVPEEETPEWAGKYPTLYALSKTPGATGREVGELIGLSRAGETIGKTAAYLARPEGLSPEAAQEAGLKPTKGELAGAGLQIAATALPYGRIAKGAGMVAGKVFSPLAAELVGGAVAGATGGYAYEAGEKLAKGEAPTPGTTTLLGAALPPAISGTGKAIKGTIGYLTQKEPARIINSLIGTRVKDFSYGKNPGRVVAEEGIVANTFDDFVTKVSDKRTEIGQELGAMSNILSSSGKSKGVTINLSNALSPVDQAINKANQTPLVNKDLITRLQNIKNDLLGVEIIEGVVGQPTRKLKGLNFNEALEIKQLIGDITKWTGNMSDDKIANAALKQVYGNIKNELIHNAQKVEPKLASRYAKLNEKYADITSAEIATKYKDKLMEGQSLISYRGHQGAIGAGIITTLATGGAGTPALIAIAGGAVLDKALGSPAVKTRIAAWLAKASPAQKNIIYRKLPNLAAAIDRVFGKETRLPGDIIADKISPIKREGIKKVLEPSASPYKYAPAGLEEGAKMKALSPPKPETWITGEGFAVRPSIGPLGREPQYPPFAGVRVEKPAQVIRKAISEGWTAVKGDKTPLLLVDKSGRQVAWNQEARKFLPVEKPYSAYQLGEMKDVTNTLYGIGGVEGEALPKKGIPYAPSLSSQYWLNKNLPKEYQVKKPKGFYSK